MEKGCNILSLPADVMFFNILFNDVLTIYDVYNSFRAGLLKEKYKKKELWDTLFIRRYGTREFTKMISGKNIHKYSNLKFAEYFDDPLRRFITYSVINAFVIDTQKKSITLSPGFKFVRGKKMIDIKYEIHSLSGSIENVKITFSWEKQLNFNLNLIKEDQTLIGQSEEFEYDIKPPSFISFKVCGGEKKFKIFMSCAFMKFLKCGFNPIKLSKF
jgi:hypothetical protein